MNMNNYYGNWRTNISYYCKSPSVSYTCISYASISDKKPYESSYLRRTFPQLSIFLNTIHF